jgi:GNAT superfamily N-acetyltransferase
MNADWVADEGEHLATEWDRDVPSDDTLLRAYIDAFAEMVETVAHAIGGRVRRNDTMVLGDADSPGAYLNAAVLLAPLHERESSDVIARMSEFFAAGNEGQWMLFSATPTPDLRPYGLQPVGHPPLMLRPVGGERRPQPDDLEVVEVADPDTLRRYERTVVDAYPMPEMAGAPQVFPDALLSDERFRLYLGLVDGEPVGTSMAHLGTAMSHVEWVTSTPAVRGRGYGEALTWAAALAVPERPSMLISSDAGRRTYERMGYVPLTRFTLWIGSRG